MKEIGGDRYEHRRSVHPTFHTGFLTPNPTTLLIKITDCLLIARKWFEALRGMPTLRLLVLAIIMFPVIVKNDATFTSLRHDFFLMSALSLGESGISKSANSQQECTTMSLLSPPPENVHCSQLPFCGYRESASHLLGGMASAPLGGWN